MMKKHILLLGVAIGVAISVGISAVFNTPVAIAAAGKERDDILVFTDAAHPVLHRNMEGIPVTVILLDAPQQLDALLSEGLPNDPATAEAVINERMNEVNGINFKDELAKAHAGVFAAWQLGVAKIPAVVVNNRYVVYGESDVARAVERITRAGRASPSPTNN